MKTNLQWPGILLAVIALGVTAAGQESRELRARDELKRGVEAYKAADYEGAMEYFKNAIRLDNDLTEAKLYLATAYMQQYVPGVDTAENKANAQQAIELYQAVLAREPQNVYSIKGIANLYMNLKDFDASRDYYKKAIAVNPEDPEAYYSVGVVDWTVVYKDISERKAKVGLSVEDRVRRRQLCLEIKAADQPVIEEGIQMLQTAMEKRQDYDDAMVYTNLLYHRKADTECGDPEAYAKDLAIANDWSDKAMATRKKKFDEQKRKNSDAVQEEQKR